MATADTWIKAHSDETLVVSIISVAELYAGSYRNPNPAEHLLNLRIFLGNFAIANLTDDIVDLYAQQRVTLQRRGIPLPDFDILIAATALHLKLALVTRNVRHFDRFTGLQMVEPSAGL